MNLPHHLPGPAKDEAQRPSDGFVLALALLAVAGWVDALGFVQWHGVYVSFMSGNTTVLAAAGVVHEAAAAIEAGRAVSAFVFGVVAGECLRAGAGRWNRSVVLIAETLLMWLACWAASSGWGEAATVTVTGVAMGVQTAVVHKAAGLAVSLTYVTGTLVNIGRSIVRALLREASWRDAFSFVALWCALLLGAATGAIAAARSTPVALLVAASLLTALAAVTSLTTWINTARASADAHSRR